ncbi:MAG TPA: hypothetical protein VHQ90_11770 [Thermoanaerobaculia bacterium]|nr:hypothetical protein [Thermoanaerobaculia bacterium]
MEKATDSRNPFAVRTPEDLSANETLGLFVDVFTDFFKIREPGHTILNGARGTGKSMMFRYLQPDCQRMLRHAALSQLPYLGVLVSVKNTYPNITELQRLVDSYANALLNEHFLAMFVACRLFVTLAQNIGHLSAMERRELLTFYRRGFLGRLRRAGATNLRDGLPERASSVDILKTMATCCDELYNDVVVYLKNLSFQAKLLPYTGALCGYLDLLVPLVEDLRSLSFIPHGPVYLLVDDGDYLNEIQTRILNSWISTRTSASISIKVSTALNYKSFYTLSRQRIDSPHDYSEVNMNDIYTSSKGKYLGRVEEIVRKRLELSGIERTPRDFFPPDEAQEDEINRIGAEIKAAWKSEGRGHRPSDDVVRYARPKYIAGLKGTRKAGSSYSYAGFEQLVHVSSGVVRFFLDAAALMYSEEVARSQTNHIIAIRPTIQDQVLRQQSEELMFGELDKMFSDQSAAGSFAAGHGSDDLKWKLHNLLKLLGGIFHQKLISNDSERRVFSVALSDEPDSELRSLFRLGVRFGYFQETTIGNKDGTGRTPLYVLTRRLAPYFFLDPTGFAGYLFVTSDKLREGLANPDQALRRIKKAGVGKVFDEGQLHLFE